MRNLLRISLILILANSTACAQNITNERMLGEWEYVGTSSQKDMIECPDVLILKNDQVYSILNDCYGVDRVSPIIETGKWSFDKDQNKITLNERKFTTNYYFKNKSLTLVGYIKKISKNEMNICFGNQGNCIDEKYVRNREE